MLDARTLIGTREINGIRWRPVHDWTCCAGQDEKAKDRQAGHGEAVPPKLAPCIGP
jgi:hypothetical protein